jgi:putative membrane protein
MSKANDTDKVDARFDPDVRFLLANERTLLAWIRTSIAVQAGGLALAHFGGKTSNVEKLLGIVIIAFGATMSVIGYQRFKAADKAIRAAKLPSIGIAPLLNFAAVVFLSIMLIVFIASE